MKLLTHIRLFAISFFAVTTLSSCGSGGDDTGSTCSPVANTNFEESETFSMTIPLASQSEFYLNGVSGNVTITGAPGASSVAINGTKRVQSESSLDANTHLADLSVDIQDLTTALLAATKQPTDKCGRNYIIDYVIDLPDFMLIRVNNVNGVVNLSAINNTVSVLGVSGNIVLNNIAGSTTADLVAGKIDAEVILPLNGTIDLKTLTGDISLLIPTNTSADLSARIMLGNITTSNLLINNLVVSPTSLSGTLGSGQGTIDLEARQIGDIDITGF